MILDEKTAQENEAGFQSQWQRLMMIFNRVFYDKPDPKDMLWLGGFEGNVYKADRLSSDEFMCQILSHMVDSDLDFQDRERPNRRQGSDPHSSHLQMYVFDRNATKSAEFDKLYIEIGNFMRRTGIIEEEAQDSQHTLEENQISSLRDRFQKLSQDWERNHPGKKFIKS